MRLTLFSSKAFKQSGRLAKIDITHLFDPRVAARCKAVFWCWSLKWVKKREKFAYSCIRNRLSSTLGYRYVGHVEVVLQELINSQAGWLPKKLYIFYSKKYGAAWTKIYLEFTLRIRDFMGFMEFIFLNSSSNISKICTGNRTSSSTTRDLINRYEWCLESPQNYTNP